MKPPKRLIFAVLVLQLSLILSGCVVVVHNNWGSHIYDGDKKTMDDISVEQDYKADLKKGRK